jgi:hypothetical protein
MIAEKRKSIDRGSFGSGLSGDGHEGHYLGKRIIFSSAPIFLIVRCPRYDVPACLSSDSGPPISSHLQFVLAGA